MNVIIKKAGKAKGPDDLVQLLSLEKQHLWNREQNMKLLREQDEAELRQLVKELDSDAEESEEDDAIDMAERG